MPDFVSGISQSLHLPDAWHEWKVRGQKLSCADFQMTVSIVAEGPSFRIIDEPAQQTISARRQAKEEKNAAVEEEAASEIVGDKSAKVYYLEGCSPTPARDRVVFKTKEEAEKAGYKLAKVCE